MIINVHLLFIIVSFQVKYYVSNATFFLTGRNTLLKIRSDNKKVIFSRNETLISIIIL